MNILITGSNGSLGQQLTKDFLKKNHTIYTVSRHKPLSHEKNHINIDLSKPNAVNEIKKQLNKLPIDVLVNNAAILCKKKYLQITEEEIELTFNINFKTPFLLIQQLTENLKLSSNPQIINIGSLSGHQGSVKFKELSIYGSSKAALSILSETLSEELTPQNIKINCFNLPGFDSKMFNLAFPGETPQLKTKEISEKITSFIFSNTSISGKIITVEKNKLKIL